MVRFASLGSGSRGNAGLVEHGGTRLLIDCGYSVRQVSQRLARLGLAPEQLSGILITHEHADHINGVVALARRFRLPVWMTHGTSLSGRLEGLDDVHVFSSHEPFAAGDLAVEPFPVPHDAREPAQFVFSDGAVRLGWLTDLGCITPHVEAVLGRCDALVLESNHDPDLLADGRYPPSLKQRVGGNRGHLNNFQAAALLEAIDTSRLQHMVAAHLSEKHNTPELVRRVLGDALGCRPDWVGVMSQDLGLDWRQVV